MSGVTDFQFRDFEKEKRKKKTRLKFSFPKSYRAVRYSTHLTTLHLSGQDRPAQGSYGKNSPTQCTSIVRYCVLELRGRRHRMDTHLVLRMTGCSKARAWKTMRLTQLRITSPHESSVSLMPRGRVEAPTLPSHGAQSLLQYTDQRLLAVKLPIHYS